jgi:hypothetical protein
MFQSIRRSIDRGRVKTSRIAVGSKPLCTMQFAQRTSLPGPYESQSVFFISSENVAKYLSVIR